MIRRIYHTAIPQAIILAVVLALFLRDGIQNNYFIPFVEAEIQQAESPEQVVLLAKGGNMLRVNSFYLDGKRVKDCTVEKVTYDQCRVTVDRSAFEHGEGWYELNVGYSIYGLINLTSTPVWIEWKET
ncbi:MAG: hypothetical protein ACI4PG_06415 [Candidatus Ventricola sp.]